MSTSKELTENWYADTSNRARLEQLLRDPTLAQALHILFVKASEPVPPLNAAQDLTQYGAMIGFTRNGYFEALKNLESLSKNPPRNPADAKPFDHEAQRTAVNRPETT